MADASPSEIARHLARADPVMGRVIERVGVRPLPVRPGGFPALVRAIVYQQISGAAGAAILRRIEAAAGTAGIPPAEWFRRASDATLRAAGLSPQKIRYVRDLARRVLDGTLSLRTLPRVGDDEVVRRLCEVHGIGEWTAQMYLIFSLRRPDVLPTGDLGVRKAVQRVYGFQSLPAPGTVKRVARPWAPYRTHGTHYLWRSLELSDGLLPG